MYPWEGYVYRRPAHFLNDTVAWQGMFSEASYNPVGSYVKEFDLPQHMLGKRISVCFEGVEQAAYVWLNGKFVGYTEDSFTPAEFDLTPYIQEKGNVLAVEVHKRSSAAFLEDQDFFRFFGIFRNVVLYAKPILHVEDMWAKPEVEQDGTGSFAVDIKIGMAMKVGADDELEECTEESDMAGKVEVILADMTGTVLYEETVPVQIHKTPGHVCDLSEKQYGEMSLALPRKLVGAVELWGYEHPVLYQLYIRLYDAKGQLIEIVPYKIGFRKVEMIDKVMMLNQKRLIINGVNRHEWSAEGGRCITLADMEWDMRCFRANNINAVRTCHYPDQIPWYYMCDENGIYMMSETNLESHGSWMKMGRDEPSWNVPGSIPEWKEVVLDRAQNNFETFKNHVSILFWSLGNESFAEDNIEAMNAYFKEKQDGRLVHYEGVVHNRAYEDTISDMESRMYSPPQEIREYLENHPKKPFILCEYMHDMGNSLGGMASYIKLIDEYEMYQGGFIWDFIDQAVMVEDEVTGRKVLRYGGDFDDRPSDYEFSGNGIVFADRTEKPAMQEVRYYYGLHK